MKSDYDKVLQIKISQAALDRALWWSQIYMETALACALAAYAVIGVVVLMKTKVVE